MFRCNFDMFLSHALPGASFCTHSAFMSRFGQEGSPFRSCGKCLLYQSPIPFFCVKFGACQPAHKIKGGLNISTLPCFMEFLRELFAGLVPLVLSCSAEELSEFFRSV